MGSVGGGKGWNLKCTMSPFINLGWRETEVLCGRLLE